MIKCNFTLLLCTINKQIRGGFNNVINKPLTISRCAIIEFSKKLFYNVKFTRFTYVYVCRCLLYRI